MRRSRHTRVWCESPPPTPLMGRPRSAQTACPCPHGWVPKRDRALGARRNAGWGRVVACWHGSHVPLLTCCTAGRLGWVPGWGGFKWRTTIPLSPPRLTACAQPHRQPPTGRTVTAGRRVAARKPHLACRGPSSWRQAWMAQTVNLAAAALPPASRGPPAGQKPPRSSTSLRPPSRSASLPSALLRRSTHPAAAAVLCGDTLQMPPHPARPPASPAPWSAAAPRARAAAPLPFANRLGEPRMTSKFPT